MATSANGARNNWSATCASRRSTKAPTAFRRWTCSVAKCWPTTAVALRQFTGEIRHFAHQPDAPYSAQLFDAVQRLEDLSDWLQDQAATNRNEVGAASVEYLHLFGYVAYAWLWARMAQVAGQKRGEDEAFYGAKIATADFYIHRLLPRILSLEQSIRAGSASLYGLSCRTVLTIEPHAAPRSSLFGVRVFYR